MLRFCFPRLFSQFPEGAIVAGRFTFTASGTTWAKTDGTSAAASVHHPFFVSMTRDSSGVNTLTFQAVKKAFIWVASLDSGASTAAGQRLFQVRQPSYTANTAVIVIGSDANALSDPADGSILTLCAFVQK